MLSFEKEVKKRELLKRKRELQSYVDEYKKLELEIDKINKECDCSLAVATSTSAPDPCDSRSYTTIFCETCGDFWEERAGRHGYMTREARDNFFDFLKKEHEKCREHLHESIMKLSDDDLNKKGVTREQAIKLYTYFLRKVNFIEKGE